MHTHDQSLLVIAAVEDTDTATLGEALHAAPEIIVIEIFAGGRLERVNLTPLRINARHHMLDRAVFTRRIHRLENEQHRPAVLGIQHVLHLCEDLHSHGERFLGPRLVFGRKFERVAGVDVLQAKPVIGHAEGLGKLSRLLDQVFHLFVVHKMN
jgi:hypothetical protein